MGFLIGWAIKLLGTSSGQSLVSWLIKFLWEKASAPIREEIAKEKLKTYIAGVLADYEKAVKDATEKAKDGLTPEEIEEIRRKKIEIEERLMNGNPS